MTNITSDLKTLQEETLLNLKNSKAKNTIRAYKSDLEILDYFVLKMDLNLYHLSQK